MNPKYLIETGINPALNLLPVTMDTDNARVIMLAIAYQESEMNHRRQIGGPARSYWQFEKGGMKGVLAHHASKGHIKTVLDCLDMGYLFSDPVGCHAAIETNDIVAAAFARLLMWTDPHKLPEDIHGSWALYLRTWRPGEPYPDKWPKNYNLALEHIKNGH